MQLLLLHVPIDLSRFDKFFKMSVFSQRPNGYKAGVVLLLVGCVAFVVGFASPSWTEFSLCYSDDRYFHFEAYEKSMVSQHVEIEGHNGLWDRCLDTTGSMHCESIDGGTPGWFTAVRSLQCLALIGLLVSGSYAIVLNWMQVNPAYNRLVEIVAVLAGLLGFVSAIEYAVKARGEDFDLLHGQDGAMASMTPMLHQTEVFGHVSWAFAVSVFGSVMSFLSAIVIAVYNPIQGQVDPSPDGQTHCPASPATSDGHPYTHNRTPNTLVQRPAAPATNVQVYYMPQPAASASAAPQGFGPPAYDAPYPGLIQHQPVVITGLTTSANANAVVAMATSSEAAGRPTCVDDRGDSAVATGKPGPTVFLD